jgi:hypothetical protein
MRAFVEFDFRVAVLAVAMAGLLPVPAMAWSALGHSLVGDLAEDHLSPAARREVRRLLAEEADPTLGEVAGWADALRSSDAARFRATSRWHYINAKGGGCGFDLARDCAAGDCIVAAIGAQRGLLGDGAQPLAVRRDALKFIVHLVGDLHQPLHAGNREDSGGNGFQVSLRRSAGQGQGRDRALGTNLHSVWDQHVLASAGLDREQYAARLRGQSAAPGALGAGAPLAWAVESCTLIDRQQVYPEGHAVDERYLEAQRPLAERRIVLAAARLAALINETLAPRARVTGPTQERSVRRTGPFHSRTRATVYTRMLRFLDEHIGG